MYENEQHSSGNLVGFRRKSLLKAAGLGVLLLCSSPQLVLRTSLGLDSSMELLQSKRKFTGEGSWRRWRNFAGCND